jgi:hypothetical protein
MADAYWVSCGTRYNPTTTAISTPLTTAIVTKAVRTATTPVGIVDLASLVV